VWKIFQGCQYQSSFCFASHNGRYQHRLRQVTWVIASHSTTHLDWNGFCATISCHTPHKLQVLAVRGDKEKKRKRKRKNEEIDICRRLFLLVHTKAQARPVSLVIPPSPSQTIADGEEKLLDSSQGITTRNEVSGLSLKAGI